MTKTVEKNYTDAQEAELSAAAPITNDVALVLAEKFGKDVRSIRAKAVRMGIYQKAVKASKTGGPIERKETIVADIARVVNANMEGLEKAPKLALIAIRSALAA